MSDDAHCCANLSTSSYQGNGQPPRLQRCATERAAGRWRGSAPAPEWRPIRGGLLLVGWAREDSGGGSIRAGLIEIESVSRTILGGVESGVSECVCAFFVSAWYDADEFAMSSGVPAVRFFVVSLLYPAFDSLKIPRDVVLGTNATSGGVVAS